MPYNVLELGEKADFEALNCQPALNLIRSTKLQLSTEPAFLPNACVCPDEDREMMGEGLPINLV